MLTSYLYTVYFLIGFSAKTHLQYVSCVLYPPFCCICRMFFNLFFFLIKGFYKAAEIGGYVGAREADAEAWSKHTTDAKT